MPSGVYGQVLGSLFMVLKIVRGEKSTKSSSWEGEGVGGREVVEGMGDAVLVTVEKYLPSVLAEFVSL